MKAIAMHARRLNAFVCCAVVAHAAAAAAATTTYTGAWSGGTIAAGDTVQLDDGATVTGNVIADGTLQFNQTTTLTMSGTILGTGGLSLTNTGTLALTGLTSGTGMFDLAITAAAGQLNVGATGTAGTGTNAMVVGRTGIGTLTITGGRVTNGNGFLGFTAGSLGAATMSSGTWTNSRLLHVGFSGTGSLAVVGGHVTNTSGVIGNTGGTGAVTVSSGTWTNTGPLYIGGYTGGFGTGTLEITGGLVTNTGVGSLGNAGGDGMAIIRGGTWANTSALLVGRSGTGTITVTGGLVSTVTGGTIGTTAGGGGSVTVTGGTFSNAASLVVGSAGTATLTISGSGGSGGVVIVGGTLARGSLGTINLLSGGTLQIGTGSTSGVLATDLVNDGSLVFNRIGSGTVAVSISGSGSVRSVGSGTLTFSGTSGYVGPTQIDAGTVLVGGTLGGTAVSVQSGGRLGGSGAIAGGVVVGSGGTLSPGASIESLSVGAVALADGATFAYEVDSSAVVLADLLRVDGNLSLGGTVELLLADLAASPTPYPDGTTLSLVTYGGSWNGGLFSHAGTPLANGDVFSFGDSLWAIDYDATTGGGNFTGDYLPGGSFINIVAVPEPSTVVLLLAAVAWAGLRSRRARPDAVAASMPPAGESATKPSSARSPPCPMV